ncbi:MAG: pyridoxamine 5'-phosphate oxidase family protein, partial [Sterolibacterium sp.]
DPLLQEYPEADLIVRIKVGEMFFNCPRYVHRMSRVESSKYVPQAGKDTPVPQWKRINAIQDVLPAKVQGVAEKLGGSITPEEYAIKVMTGEG